MQRSLVFLWLTVILVGCDLGEQAAPPTTLRGVFILTDTVGQQATSFRVGENFDLSYLITNPSLAPVTYHKGNSGPVASFKILQGDSLIATSLDGYVFE